MFRPKVPRPSDLAAGLTLGEWPAVRAAADRLRDTQEAHQRAAQRLNAAVLAVEQMASNVQAGHADVHALEDALRTRQAAALLLDRSGQDVTAAEAGLTNAQAQAGAAIATEAGKRRDKLQTIANELAPTLARLREAEGELDMALARLQRDLLATGLPATGPAGVPPLDWPGPLASG